MMKNTLLLTGVRMSPHKPRRIVPRAVAIALVALTVGACSNKTQDGDSQPTGESSRSTGAVGRFSARHDITLEVPEGTSTLRAWIAMPSESDPHQRISSWRVEAPYPTRKVYDVRGNNFLLMEAENPVAGTVKVSTSFDVERDEVLFSIDASKTRPHTEAELIEHAGDLAPSSQSVIDDRVRSMAARIVGDEKNPIRAARLLYDAVLGHVEYHVKDPKPDSQKTMKASGTGSSQYTLEQCTGNCTDFHSLYAALSRACGIPTRAVYGSFFKGPLDGQDKDQSYHCWIEFHAPNFGWVPLDVAVADIFVAGYQANEFSRPRANLTVANGYAGPDRALVEYYFGSIDERRVVWHRGRDLIMREPRQAGAPLLWNPKAYVEIDGAPATVDRKLTYTTIR